MSLRSFTRRVLTRRTVDAPATILMWWGSYGYSGRPTIGDLMAVDNLSQCLNEHGVEHAVISHSELGQKHHFAVDNILAIKPVSTVVFVCGPLTDSRQLRDFLNRQGQARKVAVGVSVLANHDAMNRRFDRIVARDGIEPSYFDLAITRTVAPAAGKTRRAALCLRGHQKEYGKDRPAKADESAAFFRDLTDTHGIETFEIDTILSPTNGAEEILSGFANSDIVLTTRMHGALLALAAGKPVIALDQIPGGAKVSAVLSKVGWPLAFNTSTVTSPELHSVLERIRAAPGEVDHMIVHAQDRIEQHTGRALTAGLNAIASG